MIKFKLTVPMLCRQSNIIRKSFNYRDIKMTQTFSFLSKLIETNKSFHSSARLCQFIRDLGYSETERTKRNRDDKQMRRKKAFRKRSDKKSVTSVGQLGDHDTPLFLQLQRDATNISEFEASPEDETNTKQCIESQIEKLKHELNTMKEDVNKKIEILHDIPPIDAIQRFSDPMEDSQSLSMDYIKDTDLVTNPKRPDVIPDLVGTPDPSIPASSIHCSGCGAILHCRDADAPGYMSTDTFKNLSENALRKTRCNRCYIIIKYQKALNVSVDVDKYQKLMSEIKDKKALVLLVVDLTDVTNSIYKDILHAIGKNRQLYIVGNKVDLIVNDKPNYMERIKANLFNTCESMGLNISGNNIRHVCLVSGKTGFGIEQLVTKLLHDWERKGHVFLVGATNCGKSTLFNALLSSDYCKSHVRDHILRATVCKWPGTTLSLLNFPIINMEPWKLYNRVQRLKIQQEEEFEKTAYQKKKAKETGLKKYIPLRGIIGQTDFQADVVSEKEPYACPESYAFSENVELKPGMTKRDFRPMIDWDQMNKVSRWFYDTPGLIQPSQIINSLTQDELDVVVPKVYIQPRTFTLKPGQVMFVSGLARLNYEEGSRPIKFTVHTSSTLPVEVLHQEEADAFYIKNFGNKKLGVPLGNAARLQMIPALIGRAYQLTGISWWESMADIQLSSIGWVSITAGEGMQVSVRAYTPGGRGCILRTPALLPFSVIIRGKRIQGTPRYMIKKPRTF